MTVGIGILNRSGVVLSADTFEPVVGIQSLKFVSISKIFPLSKYNPVGIMLDGSVRFMDTIPWESIIEVYRSQIGDKSFDKLQEYAENFIEFIPNDNRFYSWSAEMGFLKEVLRYCLSKIQDRVQLIEGNEKAISDEIDNQIASLSKKIFSNSFDDNFIKLFLEKHTNDLKEYIKNSTDHIINPVISAIDERTQKNLITMCAYVISKTDYMIRNIYNGSIVISGYGDKEIFPSLYRYNIVCAIDGKLIYELIESYSIGSDDENELLKKIIPFGEKDLINTYINGINPNLEYKILDEAKKIFDKFLKEIQNKYNNNNALQEFIVKEKDEIDKICMLIIEDLKKNIKDLQQKMLVDPLLSMIDFIRKEDMISLADALVNLTAIGVKFSSYEQAEVGPIDIALITKGDGFVFMTKK
ncbi:hypothetical protein [Clostridium cibarium]|uniref:Uncharacterized protein n=1 Tax=Clostridium cibarium TaxID=2762247 RepID=A0ABR8PX85_9CLOT|nr:hypothetical protein [Clostridium cibarium]MBD7912780.1 hypothetical protein [Clostridium cibarium]